MSKAYTKWLKRIKDVSSPWTENEIIYFRKAIGPAGIKDAVLRSKLVGEFNRWTVRHITREQSERGRNYLLSKSFKQNGNRRKGCIFGTRELDILNKLYTHYFVGLYWTNNRYTVPIYRAVDVDGNFFDYTGTYYSNIKIVG